MRNPLIDLCGMNIVTPLGARATDPSLKGLQDALEQPRLGPEGVDYIRPEYLVPDGAFLNDPKGWKGGGDVVPPHKKVL